MAEEYTYAVARVHAKELSLLTRQDLEQLLGCPTESDCLRVLSEKGFGEGQTGLDAEHLLEYEYHRTWEFLTQLMGDDTGLDLFRIGDDYHNLKAAVKCAAQNVFHQGAFRRGGTLSWEDIYQAVKEQDWERLPKKLAECGEKAYSVLLQTKDGQAADMVIDRDCLEQILEKGMALKNETLREYARQMVALANLRVAVRCVRTGKGHTFLEQALVPCPGQNLYGMMAAAGEGIEQLGEYLQMTEFREAAGLVKGSYAQLEKWCDNRLFDVIRSQKHQVFGLAPLAGYWLAREAELGAVRLILSAKRNGLNTDLVRERLRELYV
ncbi:MAG: V-type ATPase subunit [Massiliimalia sp.]|jgi:V/A-type H+-transporting ATPase subunit C